MTNAFEKQSPKAPIWSQPLMPAAIDSKMTAFHLPSANQNSAATALINQPSIIEAGKIGRPVGGLIKRMMDLVIATTALVLAAPVMIIIALLVNVTTGGPAMFFHIRVGLGGKPFNCYKFRSMVANADEVLRVYLEANPQAREEWQESQKIRHDPRVTVLGRILRKSSLDELPQLFNIIRGDMSCVGPRPVVTEELKRYGDHVREYLGARPGLTGLWQVSGRSNMDYASRVALDTRYVRNWSVWLDITILLRTILTVTRFDKAF